MLLEQARTRSGTAWARQPKITSVMRQTVIVRALTAAGCRGLTTVPSGSETVIGLKQPSLFGNVGSVTQRTQ